MIVLFAYGMAVIWPSIADPHIFPDLRSCRVHYLQAVTDFGFENVPEGRIPPVSIQCVPIQGTPTQESS